MKDYRCSNCGYKTKKEKAPTSCNYCSEIGCLREIAEASEILDSIK